MVPFFSDSGLRRLDDIVGPDLLCVFDFDGTLAPIVEEPQKASLPQDVLQRLSVLSRHVRLAILTGRSVADIQPRLGFEPDYLIGNHGAEGMPGWQSVSDEYRRLAQAWKAALSQALRDESRFGSSVWVEDKAYSLTVHYRAMKEDDAVQERLRALFARELPNARVIAGKSIFNLVPPNAPHKGDALEKLMELAGARHAIYVGDDVTDEDVFELRRPDIMTVRVEHLAGSAAEFFLPHWTDIVSLLDELIKRLQEMQASGVRLA